MQLLTYKDQELYFLDRPVKSYLPQPYQNPVYLYHGPFLKSRGEFYQRTLPQGMKSFFAMKSNHNVQVLKVLKDCGFGVDAVSQGEIEWALKIGFQPQEIIFSGVGKTKKELEYAIQNKIFQINIESLPELLRVIEIAKSLQQRPQIGLRVNPDISIESHPYISTGLKENKFGIDFLQLTEVVEVIEKNSEAVEFKGLSVHLGSQMLELEGFQEGLKIVSQKWSMIQKKFSTLTRLDVGGGLGIDYHKQDLNYEQELLKKYSQIITQVTQNLGCELMSEPGRWLVGHSGVLLAEVQYVKSQGEKKFIIVDSGMNHLMRPCLYGAYHQVFNLNERQIKVTYDVVGPICESSDFFAKNHLLSETLQGDYIAVADVGAYGFVMKSDYNLQTAPTEIFIDT